MFTYCLKICHKQTDYKHIMLIYCLFYVYNLNVIKLKAFSQDFHKLQINMSYFKKGISKLK